MSKRRRPSQVRRRPAVDARQTPGERSGPPVLPPDSGDPNPGELEPGDLGSGDGAAPGQAGRIETGHVQMLVGLIATGALDEHLGQIQAAISQRHHLRVRAASNQAAADLEVGDRVMLNHAIRPLYLHGAAGTVTGWAGQSVVVQLDHPTGRFTAGVVRCPPLGLRRLDA